MSESTVIDSEIDFLFSPAAIRAGASQIFDLAARDQSFFRYREEKLKPTIDFVMKVIAKNYPDMNIPFHSRWGHFRAGRIDRVGDLDKRLADADKLEKARVKLDLAVTSVLLDAGSGPDWSYLEKETSRSFNRSEGLGVASYHMFLSGAMSSTSNPNSGPRSNANSRTDRGSLRADADGLAKITEDSLSAAFQSNRANPLLGVPGRVLLLQNLGKACANNRDLFPTPRPGAIIDGLQTRHGSAFPASAVLRAVLDGFGPIWPGRLSASGINLGDTWRHSKLKDLVPFHKLSQWMTYSLIEPIQEAGFEVTRVEELTGLAEYRNGGLMLDSGLIELKDPKLATRSWRPDSDLVIEWRALTVHLLDRIAEGVQKALGKTAREFPLAKVLEGGTWWAGRELAKEKRPPGGGPPLSIESDGTVF